MLLDVKTDYVFYVANQEIYHKRDAANAYWQHVIICLGLNLKCLPLTVINVHAVVVTI